MKTRESIRLILAATLLLGLLSSLLLFYCLSNLPADSKIAPLSAVLAPIPFVLACATALFQFKYVITPWSKALGELVATALNIQETTDAPVIPNSKKKEAEPITAPAASSADDQLRILRTSIESAAVQVKETKLREMTFIQHAVDVICVIDLQCKILSVNPASRSVWGYTSEELVGRQITDFLVSEADVTTTRKMLFGAEKSIDKIFFENKFRKKSGDVVDLLWSAHLSAREKGLYCIAHDITDRKRAEQLLRESEGRVRGILESLPAGVAVVNPKGVIEFMNKTAIDLTGHQFDKDTTLPASSVFSFIKQGETGINTAAIPELANLKNFNKNDESAPLTPSFDCQIMCVTGERFPAEASIRNLSWGKSNACLIIFLDATMKHELEKAKREFVAMVSHDLRTPLTTIGLIFVYLLDGLGGELSSDGAEFATRGKQACDRLMTLVQDLLDLEKMRAGKFVMDLRETPISEIVTAAVKALEPYAGSQGIKLSSDCEAELDGICDGGRIIQVLINLISNGVKFSEPDGVVALEAKSEADLITISVANKGRAIPADKLLSIFEKFEQADSKGAIERKGTGLGLAISKTIIEQHEGKIWAESSESTGTKFLFTLPKAAPIPEDD